MFWISWIMASKFGLNQSVILQVFFLNNISLLEDKKTTQKCPFSVQCIQSSCVNRVWVFRVPSLSCCGSLWHTGDKPSCLTDCTSQPLQISTCYQQSGKSYPLNINTHFTRAWATSSTRFRNMLVSRICKAVVRLSSWPLQNAIHLM